MHVPGLPSLLFLFYVLIVIPVGAFRTARRLRGTGAPVSRLQYWRSAVLTQAFLLLLTLLVGAGFGYELFAIDRVSVVDALLTLAALAICLVLRQLSRMARSEVELRNLLVYQRSPRTTTESALFVAAALLASVGEELAYRGVGWTILTYSLGAPWLAAFIMCVAFALGHWSQGWKSLVTIFLFAAVMHGLVAATNTIVLAMVAHAVYDLVVGRVIARQARRYDQELAAS